MNWDPHQDGRVDLYGLLAAALAPHAGSFPPVVVDGGASVGGVSAALAARFPSAVVHAFEPGAEAYAALAASAGPRVRAHRLALGEEAGPARLRTAGCTRMASLLGLNAASRALLGGLAEPGPDEEVQRVRLDAWAAGCGVPGALLLKLDLQGAELAALRGAGCWLGGVAAVVAEARLVPEYEGAATLGEIDAYLGARGFGLYQLARVLRMGPHLRPVSGDGVWLRRDVLDAVCAAPPPPQLAADAGAALGEVLARLGEAGCRAAAVWGPGRGDPGLRRAVADALIPVPVWVDGPAEESGAEPSDAAARLGAAGVDAVAVLPGGVVDAAVHALLEAGGGAVVDLADPAGPTLHEADAAPAARVAARLEALAAGGFEAVAVYGAGRHTRRAVRALRASPLPVVALLDDAASPPGVPTAGPPPASWLGPPLLTPGAFAAGLAPGRAAATAVLLSSDAHEAALRRRSGPLRAAGLRVVGLGDQEPRGGS